MLCRKSHSLGNYDNLFRALEMDEIVEYLQYRFIRIGLYIMIRLQEEFVLGMQTVYIRRRRRARLSNWFQMSADKLGLKHKLCEETCKGLEG